MPTSIRSRRAIGIVRVSRTKGREGESFHSPGTQRARIGDACDRNGWRLLEVHEELDASGGKSLDGRPGLRAAVEAIEARQADVLAVAYLDRLTRDPRVRDEVVDRVEAAGGEVWTVDIGRQTNGTAAEQHAEFRLPRAENPRGLGPAGQLCRRNDGPVEFLDERDLNTYTSGGGRIGCSWIRPR